MTFERPESLEFNVAIADAVDMKQLLRFAIEHVVDQDGFAPKTWELRSEIALGQRRRTKKGVPELSDYDRLGEHAFRIGFSIDGVLGSISAGPILPHDAKDQPYYGFGLTSGFRLHADDTSFLRLGADGLLRLMKFQVDILRAAGQELPVAGAYIRRNTPSYVGPFPPLAPPFFPAMVLKRQAIVDAYDDVDGFFAAWDTVEELANDRVLLTRGRDVVDETDFKLLGVERGVALARAAKPGATEFLGPDPSEREEEALEALESHLTEVGYFADTATMEFTAMVPDGSRLAAVDIILLCATQEYGTAEDEPVETLIVTFPTEAMARQESKLLLDMGVRVQYYRPDDTLGVL